MKSVVVHISVALGIGGNTTPSIRAFNKKAIFDWVARKAEELGQPFTKRGGGRGRNFAITPCPYASLFVIAVFFDVTERDVELAELLVGGT